MDNGSSRTNRGDRLIGYVGEGVPRSGWVGGVRHGLDFVIFGVLGVAPVDKELVESEE